MQNGHVNWCWVLVNCKGKVMDRISGEADRQWLQSLDFIQVAMVDSVS